MIKTIKLICIISVIAFLLDQFLIMIGTIKPETSQLLIMPVIAVFFIGSLGFLAGYEYHKKITNKSNNI